MKHIITFNAISYYYLIICFIYILINILELDLKSYHFNIITFCNNRIIITKITRKALIISYQINILIGSSILRLKGIIITIKINELS